MMQTLPNFESATDSLPELIRHLRHRLASTRLAAVKALGKLGWQTGESVAALSSSLNDEDELVRESAAQAIGQLGPNAVSAMIRMLNNKDKYVRRHAVWALGKLGPKAVPAIATLCQSLKDADPRTATGAAQALGEIGSEGAPAVAELAIAMRGTNVVLCRLAAKALSQIGKPALPTLLVHLAHHDPFIKAEAAMAVGWMGPKAEAAIPKLVEILNLPAPRDASSNASGMPSESVPSPVDTARAAAATALGRMGTSAEPAMSELQLHASDFCPAVAQAVAQAMRLIRGSRPL